MNSYSLSQSAIKGLCSLPYRKPCTEFLVPRRLVAITLLAVMLYASDGFAATENELRCGQLNNAFGPFDYRVTTDDNKRLVENAHFTPQVEHLIKGQSTYLGGDIDYTLRVFPNHPRALKSLMELSFRIKTENPTGTHWPVWCYFDRAIRFRADDAQVRMVYAIYLHRKGKPREAIEQLNQAKDFTGDNANIHYNLGLIFLDVGDYENSLIHAHKAYALGFQLEGLRNRLMRANKWHEPQAVIIESDTSNVDQAQSETTH